MIRESATANKAWLAAMAGARRCITRATWCCPAYLRPIYTKEARLWLDLAAVFRADGRDYPAPIKGARP